ncbi:MAG: stage V sporulation protein AD [Lachnospiraceae bacterium]|nr:stage V sporulation protein AD [Lachnospiraceae bacterium]
MENQKMMGTQSIAFRNPPWIISAASVVGQKEGEGPLGSYFDVISEDPMFGGTSWEDAESRMMKLAVEQAINKSGLSKEKIRYLVGGDLLGQLIATFFGVEALSIPMFGVYGACSTMGESLGFASVLVDGGYADTALAVTSSHFAGAEKQFRFPLAYGNQRPLAATWTVTGSGALIVSRTRAGAKDSETKSGEHDVRVIGMTPGRIVDYGVKDSMNMGACMAPAACDTIAANLRDFGVKPDYYDKIITGDLGYVGQEIVIALLKEKGYDIKDRHLDCGILIYDREVQDTHSGGSGCGCSAVTLAGYLLRQLRTGKWKRILFVPTGALLSPVSFNEGNPVPGIAHAVMLEAV